LGQHLISVLGPNNPGAKEILDQFADDKKKYTEQSKDLQDKALAKAEASEAAERRALHYDLGEGLLEIALVLSSLYFIARKMLFPVVAIIAGLAGIIVALSGLWT
jgi:hypothetical protein